MFRSDRIGRRFSVDEFDDGDKLEIAAFTFEKLVDVEGLVGIMMVYAGQDIYWDFVRFEEFDGIQYFIACSSTVAVMDLWWSIKTDAHEEVVHFQELAPLFVDEESVGLDGVGGFSVGEGDGLLEKVQTHEGGFTTLPVEGGVWQFHYFADVPV